MEIWQIRNLKKPHPSRLVGVSDMWNGLVPHPCVVDKNLRGISQEESHPHVRPPSPGLRYQEDKSPQLLATKTRGDWVGGRDCWSPNQFLLMNPHADSPIQTHSLEAPVMGVVAWGAPVACRGRLRCLASRRVEAIVPFLGPSPNRASRLMPI